MVRTAPLPAILVPFIVFIAVSVAAQSTFPANAMSPPGGTPPFDTSLLYSTMLNRQAEDDFSQSTYPETPSNSVSRLDLKAPGKARREYAKGFQLMNKKEYPGAIESLTRAVAIYPEFVAAHNALGSSYLGMGKSEQARDEFAKAVALDDHLPTSHLNLGCAEFALKNYAAAEADVKRASSIAPLDLHFLTALAYAQLLNHDYGAAVATAHQVHGRKHEDAAIVHYYAAVAWDGQNNLEAEKLELQTLIKEDPHSAAANQARGMLQQIEEEQVRRKGPGVVAQVPTFEFTPTETPTKPAEVPTQVRKLMQDAKEQQQVTEAEAMCESCEGPVSGSSAVVNNSHDADLVAKTIGQTNPGWTVHRSVDEVAIFFAATDHGKAVSDLTQSDIEIRDNRESPVSVVGFRTEAQLPLRLGILIDTSDSITERFSFEQKTAIDFVRKVVTGRDDQGFVVGFSNSVLLVQDFTTDGSRLSDGIGKLAPKGGTALWDAVTFAAEKLADIHESQPVAKVLVVITDGEDNSSGATLKQAIETAEHGEVIVYTVSTRDNRDLTAPLRIEGTPLGDRALRTLADRTGGTAFFPGSLSGLGHSLTDLQQVIRSRYMVSYRPALFKRNGQYRSIDITAQKAGHKLRVYARKGYYAETRSQGGGL